MTDEPGGSAGGGQESPRSFLSPAVRQALGASGLDPATLVGSGGGGRLTLSDVRSAASTLEVGAAGAGVGGAPGGGHHVEPFSAIRRRIAEHLVRSKATAAHAYTSVRVDLDAVERVRRTEGAAWRAAEGFGLTYLPFVTLALTRALAEHPELNGWVRDDGVVRSRRVHVGIAVDLDHRGLIVPVVRDAQDRSIRELARCISELAHRARTATLTPDDVTGGTFTITNPGPTGSALSVPILNQGQVGILATDGVRRRVVVVATPEGDVLALRPVATLGLSFDHRALDAYAAAAFLHRLRTILETTDWSAEVSSGDGARLPGARHDR